VLKSMEQYMRDHNVVEQPSKRYFQGRTLEEIIGSYPVMRKGLSQKEIEKEMQNRLSLIDFLHGLLNLNPLERWSPQQAKMHPFITGEKFTGPFTPPLRAPSMKPMLPVNGPPSSVSSSQSSQAAASTVQQVSQPDASAAAATSTTQSPATGRRPRASTISSSKVQNVPPQLQRLAAIQQQSGPNKISVKGASERKEKGSSSGAPSIDGDHQGGNIQTVYEANEPPNGSRGDELSETGRQQHQQQQPQLGNVVQNAVNVAQVAGSFGDLSLSHKIPPVALDLAPPSYSQTQRHQQQQQQQYQAQQTQAYYQQQTYSQQQQPPLPQPAQGQYYQSRDSNAPSSSETDASSRAAAAYVAAATSAAANQDQRQANLHDMYYAEPSSASDLTSRSPALMQISEDAYQSQYDPRHMPLQSTSTNHPPMASLNSGNVPYPLRKARSQTISIPSKATKSLSPLSINEATGQAGNISASSGDLLKGARGIDLNQGTGIPLGVLAKNPGPGSPMESHPRTGDKGERRSGLLSKAPSFSSGSAQWEPFEMDPLVGGGGTHSSASNSSGGSASNAQQPLSRRGSVIEIEEDSYYSEQGSVAAAQSNTGYNEPMLSQSQGRSYYAPPQQQQAAQQPPPQYQQDSKQGYHYHQQQQHQLPQQQQQPMSKPLPSPYDLEPSGSQGYFDRTGMMAIDTSINPVRSLANTSTTVGQKWRQTQPPAPMMYSPQQSVQNQSQLPDPYRSLYQRHVSSSENLTGATGSMYQKRHSVTGLGPSDQNQGAQMYNSYAQSGSYRSAQPMMINPNANVNSRRGSVASYADKQMGGSKGNMYGSTPPGNMGMMTVTPYGNAPGAYGMGSGQFPLPDNTYQQQPQQQHLVSRMMMQGNPQMYGSSPHHGSMPSIASIPLIPDAQQQQQQQQPKQHQHYANAQSTTYGSLPGAGGQAQYLGGGSGHVGRLGGGGVGPSGGQVGSGNGDEQTT
jgi:hypothetical protein